VTATHLVIPDTQVKPDAPTDHLDWIGQYVVDQLAGRDDVKVVHLGDHWDMPSLSSYDQRYKRRMEGRRLVADVDAGNDALKKLRDPTRQWNRARKKKVWEPEWHLLRGNHEDRLTRAEDENAQAAGIVGLHMLDNDGWTVHPYLEPVVLDGVTYAHYFYNPMTGNPFSGQAATRLKQVGTSFTMGHQQTLDYAIRFVNGRSQHALIAGACYLHDEEYKGPQGNAHWRGVVVCHQVEKGSYDPMFVSLDYLCRRYEGKTLKQFVGKSWMFQ
jgi:hypothetical protein